MIFTLTKSSLLRDYLMEIGLSRKLVKAIKSQGKILVNGNPVTVRCQLRPGDRLEIIMPEEKCDIPPTEMDLDVVFEDDHYLIIDKPAGLACIPTKSHYENSLANGIVAYYLKKNITATVHFVNRLDRQTQGLLLVAKDRYSHYLLSQDIKQVKRVYQALVSGHLREKQTIDLPILDDGVSMIRTVNSQGKHAITHVKPLQEDGANTIVQCILDTGRTHQIRVHLKAIGHPLVSDELYNPGIGKMYLRSVRIEFINPYDGKLVTIEKLEKRKRRP